MGGNKRKRDEDYDSDDDPSYGMRQILPVATLPANFNGEPEDGLQYLFTVRRDAKLLPAVTRVPNPYESAPYALAQTGLATDNTKGTIQDQLSEEWRTTFLRRFTRFRENLNQPTHGTNVPAETKLMPEKKDREAWWNFICGAPESVWHKPPSKRSAKPKRKGGGGLHGELDPSDPDVVAAGWQIVPSSFQPAPEHPALDQSTPNQLAPDIGDSTTVTLTPSLVSDSAPSSPREPTPTLILSMDHRIAIHLIMYFTYWINQHLEGSDRPNTTATESYTPLESHARWIFALLARVDSYCSADDMNGLRSLVRACLAFIRSQNPPCSNALLHSIVGDADSDIASTPGVSPLDLPHAEDAVDPAHQLLHTEKMEARVGAPVPQSPPVMSANSVRLILCAVAGYWHQRDLWADAEGAFGLG